MILLPHRRSPITPGTFTVFGGPIDTLYPRRRSVTWTHGILAGDSVMVASARDDSDLA